MAFAPHDNTRVRCQFLAGFVPTTLPMILGCFTHRETNMHFEYAERRWFCDDFAPDFPHIVYVGEHGDCRLARVLQTVAYVVVDEAADGSPVVEKWQIKAHRHYPTDWISK